MNSATGVHTPATLSITTSRRGSISLDSVDWADVEDTPVPSRQVSVVENQNATELQTRLAQISLDQTKSVLEKISIPECYASRYPEESAQMKANACLGVMQGLFTEEDYNNRVAMRFAQIVLPSGISKIVPEVENELKAMAFHGIMTGAFSVEEFNEKFAVMFFVKVNKIWCEAQVKNTVEETQKSP